MNIYPTDADPTIEMMADFNDYIATHFLDTNRPTFTTAQDKKSACRAWWFAHYQYDQQRKMINVLKCALQITD